MVDILDNLLSMLGQRRGSFNRWFQTITGVFLDMKSETSKTDSDVALLPKGMEVGLPLPSFIVLFWLNFQVGSV